MKHPDDQQGARTGVRRRAPLRRRVLWLVVAAPLLVAGCSSGSSGADSARPTTSFHYLVNPLEPGHGYVQLGANRYPFSGVICATGPVKSDPEGSTRIFGVYANFHVDGKLAAVSLTRYRSAVHGSVDTIPTITDTALVRMQGKGEIRGLTAQRARVENRTKWQDVNDPSATTALITRKGDRYEAHGRFGPVGGDTTPQTSSTRPGAKTGTVGEIAARCPSSETTTTAATSTVTTSTTP